MKALVISDDVKTLEFVNDILSKNGVDVINYKWLVKALDNIEEINPDLIVVNVLDYPRHWKTLAQFVKTIFFNKISICLFVPEGFSGGEMKKARTLEIDFCCHSQEEFEKCIHNFTQTKRTFLQNLKKIYSEKDDSSIISVTDLLQLLGTTFVNKSDDIKLHSALELFNALEEISNKPENAVSPEKSHPIEQSKPIEDSKNTVDEQKNDGVETAREIKNIASHPIEKPDANEDDYTLPTVENLLESSGEECVLPTAASLFAGENSTESEHTETAENEEGLAPATDETSNNADDCALPTVENLLESSGEECVLPTAASLFAGENSTESEHTETAENAEGLAPATDETSNGADDYTLPTAENIVDENEVVSAVDTSVETPVENEREKSLETENNIPVEESGDYTLPTAENLLESSSEECVLPTATSLFAGENSIESEHTETAENEEGLAPATDETSNNADDYTLPTAENIVDENEVVSAVDTSVETPVENESEKPLETENNIPVEESGESEADVVSSVDSKKHFGSLFRLIQEKYENE